MRRSHTDVILTKRATRSDLLCGIEKPAATFD
jgi:hypothetical protein